MFIQCNCQWCSEKRKVALLTSERMRYAPGPRQANTAEAERITATQILAMQGKPPLPKPLTIPAGAQARLDAQVKKLERKFAYVIDGLAGAYDVFHVPYVAYSWGLDVLASENSGPSWSNITDKQCDDIIARFVDEFERLATAAQTTGDSNDPRFHQVVWRKRPVFGLSIGDEKNGRLTLSTRLHF